MSAPAFEGLEPAALTWLLRPPQPVPGPDDAVIAGLALGEEPDWLCEQRARAQARFAQVGAPSRRQEAWRHVDLSGLSQTLFEPPPPPTSDQAARAEGMLAAYRLPVAPNAMPPLRLCFVNGVFSERFSDTPETIAAAAPGLTLTTLQRVLREPGALNEAMRQRLQDALLGDCEREEDAFALLNAAQTRDAALLLLPDDARLTRPLHLIWAQIGEPERPHACVQRALLLLGARAQATVYAQFVGDDAAPYWANSVIRAVCDAQSDLRLILAHADGAQGLGFLAARAALAQDSQLTLTSCIFGGRLARCAMAVDLTGEGAKASVYGLNALRESVQAHQRMEMRHQAPRAQSAQTFKCILDGQSRAEFDGLIVVARDAIGADATQLNKNLLLSDQAQAVTRPQLRIDADDVKCAHGATIGQLEPDELFYLASRGIPPSVAQCLLTFGFAEDIAQSVADPAIRQSLERQILRNLDHQNSPLSCFADCDLCPASHS